MTSINKDFQQSPLVMKILGWALIAGLAAAPFVYAPDSYGEAFPQVSLTLVLHIRSRRMRAYTPTCS